MKMLREQTNSETAGRVTGIVTTLLLFICIISIAFYAYMKSINPAATPRDLLMTLKGQQNDIVKEAWTEYSFSFEPGEKPVFVLYKDYIVKCGSGGIWFLDKMGNIVWTESLTFSNPIIKTNGSQLLVADIGTGDMYVIEDREITRREKLDVTIFNADISTDGYVTTVTSSKRDNNEIRVYNPHGIELFRKIIANDFAVSAEISPSEKYLAVSGISMGTVGAYSKYKFYDLTGNELAGQTFEASEELLPIYWFNSDNSIFAAGDRAIALMNEEGKIVWQKQFTKIAGVYPNGNKRLAVAAEAGEGAMLKIYSADGQEFSSCKLEGNPEGLSAFKGNVAVHTKDNVYFFNEKCRTIGKYSSDSTIKQVYFFSRQQAAVITGNTVTIINIS